MKTEKIRESILGGKTSLGIELGSTRIKGILVDENNEVIAAGGYSWENKLGKQRPIQTTGNHMQVKKKN